MSKWEANASIKEASEFTKRINKEKNNKYDPIYDENEDKDFEEVYKRTILDYTKEEILKSAEGKILRSRENQEFLDAEETPDTVDPYLWRRIQFNRYSGIVELVEGKAYSAVGILGANSILVRTKNGWVVIDSGSNMDGLGFFIEELEKYLGENIKEIFFSDICTG